MVKDFFSPENIPQSNWMKFNKVGDTVKGTLTETFDKRGNGTLPDQKVFVLSDVEINGIAQEGSTNVAIKTANSYVLERVKRAKFGQIIGFKFEKEIPPSKPGLNPAKSITPYLGGMDPNYTPSNDTLAETDEDIIPKF